MVQIVADTIMVKLLVVCIFYGQPEGKINVVKILVIAILSAAITLPVLMFCKALFWAQVTGRHAQCHYQPSCSLSLPADAIV